MLAQPIKWEELQPEQLQPRRELHQQRRFGRYGRSCTTSEKVLCSMTRRNIFPAFALQLWSILPCLLLLRAEAGQPPEESLYLWIDAHQARVLIGKASSQSVLSAEVQAPSVFYSNFQSDCFLLLKSVFSKSVFGSL